MTLKYLKELSASAEILSSVTPVLNEVMLSLMVLTLSKIEVFWSAVML